MPTAVVWPSPDTVALRIGEAVEQITRETPCSGANGEVTLTATIAALAFLSSVLAAAARDGQGEVMLGAEVTLPLLAAAEENLRDAIGALHAVACAPPIDN